MSQLADDTTCFVLDEESGNAVLDFLQNIEECCRLKFNLDKTECIWICSNTERQPGNIPVKWSTEDFSTLGVKFITNEREMQFKNFDDKFQLMRDVLNI